MIINKLNSKFITGNHGEIATSLPKMTANKNSSTIGRNFCKGYLLNNHPHYIRERYREFVYTCSFREVTKVLG